MARGEQLIRQWKLLRLLQSRHFGVCLEDLIAELGSCKRTIQRDLKLLQGAGFPISFEQHLGEVGDRERRFWKLEHRFLESQNLVLSMVEVLSLLLSQQLLASLAGTPLGDGLKSVIGKIESVLSIKARGYFSDLEDVLIVKETVQPEFSAMYSSIESINRAISESRVLQIRYKSPRKSDGFSSAFHPYNLILHKNDLYCIGRVVAKDQIRTLKVRRLQALDLTEKKFTRPERFCLGGHLDGSFGIVYSGEYETVQARLSGWAATEVREHKWHPTQKIIGGTNDSLVVQFDLSNTMEFKTWLLSFGRHAKLLKPKHLVDELAEEIAQMNNSYAAGGTGKASHA
ncbi:MAG: WYL domain-containing transcriptional regulator [Planctomycetaceae bacterium]|nr:transcriptional regulator [Planctomycetaceae bacterium]